MNNTINFNISNQNIAFSGKKIFRFGKKLRKAGKSEYKNLSSKLAKSVSYYKEILQYKNNPANYNFEKMDSTLKETFLKIK